MSMTHLTFVVIGLGRGLCDFPMQFVQYCPRRLRWRLETRGSSVAIISPARMARVETQWRPWNDVTNGLKELF